MSAGDFSVRPARYITLKIHGEPPERLLKFYRDRRYAQMFASNGCIRASALEYYKKIDDAARRDEAEGEGTLKVPGNIPVLSLHPETLHVIN